MEEIKAEQEEGAPEPEINKSNRATRTVDMTSGNITKHLILFALPMLAGNIFQQLYNTADSIIVGNFVSGDALGAVTTTAPAINSLIGLFMGMSSGAGVVISQRFGAHDTKGMRKAIHTAITLTLYMGLAMMIIGYFATPYLLGFMKTPGRILPLANEYLSIYFLGILGLMFYNMGSGILRAVGDSQRPLYFLIFSSLLNVGLDLVFVVMFNMGVAGVAYATVLSQFISAFLIFLILFRTKENYGIRLSEMKTDPAMVKSIVNVGLPAGLQMGIIAFSNVFVQSYVNHFGEAANSGWGIYGRVDGFVMLPMQAVSMAAMTFTGQNAGARNVSRIKKGLRAAMTISIVCTLSLCVVLWMFTPQIVMLFNREAKIVYFGTLFLRMNCMFDVLCCTNQLQAGVLRGVGDAKAPMFIMIGSFVGFRQLYMFVVSRMTDLIYPVAFSFPAGWIVCSVIMYVYFHKSNWERHIVEDQETAAA